MGDSISTLEAIQYCGGVASVHVGDSVSTVGDSISTVEAIQYCGVKFLIFLYLADIANQKLFNYLQFRDENSAGFLSQLATRMSVRLINVRSCHFLFQFSVFLNYQNGGIRSKMRRFGYLGYCGYFFSDFYIINLIFRFSPIVRYENLDYKKSEIFKHLFDIHL